MSGSATMCSAPKKRTLNGLCLIRISAGGSKSRSEK